MKKTIVASIIFLSLGVTSFAQIDEKAPMNPEKRMEHRKEMKEKMAEKLGLTPEQISQVNAIDAKYEAQEMKMMKAFEELRTQRKNLMDAKRAEIKKLLTPEQAEKIEALEQRKLERRGKMKGRKPMRPE